MANRSNPRIEALIDSFRKTFGEAPALVARAPGRVNIIGEHTDYNEGFVLPIAIDKDILIAGSPAAGSQVEVYSCDYRERDAFALSQIKRIDKQCWSNYVRGTLNALQVAGHTLHGFKACISGNVPQGAGLSSSAAIEVAVAKFAVHLNRLSIEPKQIALLAQRAEHEFAGVNCGIMDQFVSVLAKPDCALMIDCRSLQSRDVPLRLSPHRLSIVVTNSGVTRGLVESAYNSRREECAHGVSLISEILSKPLAGLRDVSVNDFQRTQSQLPTGVAKRCRHVINENERVLMAESALKSDNFAELGRLMDQSHDSLRDDFQVSCREVDMLVELTRRHPGVLGARMTGAGFGGCTVAIMNAGAIDSFKTEVLPRYADETKRKPEMYVCAPSGGASVVELSLRST
jgi:galactokinase